jgi:hypothetical protein
MIIRTHSATLLGVNAIEVEIECHEAYAQPFRVGIVGLPDTAVKEARDRVMAAVRNSGFFAPFTGSITFNLAPADLIALEWRGCLLAGSRRLSARETPPCFKEGRREHRLRSGTLLPTLSAPIACMIRNFSRSASALPA